MNRDDYVAALKTAAISIGKKAVMSRLLALSPFFGLAFVNPIVALIVEKILTIAIQQGELGAFFLYIDTRTSIQGKEFEMAAFANEAIKKKGTKEEVQHAEEYLVSTFRSFVRLSN